MIGNRRVHDACRKLLEPKIALGLALIIAVECLIVLWTVAGIGPGRSGFVGGAELFAAGRSVVLLSTMGVTALLLLACVAITLVGALLAVLCVRARS